MEAQLCRPEDFLVVHDIVKELSPVASLHVLGDNEWIDCNQEDVEFAWNEWHRLYVGLEGNWTHDLDIVRLEGNRSASFYFVHKATLFIGLNIVGGKILDQENEWDPRLEFLANWTQELILEHVVRTKSANGVILMAHADPNKSDKNDLFFTPMAAFINNTLENRYPIMYLHGDGHEWRYATEFMDQASFLQVQHPGGVDPPVMKFMADPRRLGPNVSEAFWYER